MNTSIPFSFADRVELAKAYQNEWLARRVYLDHANVRLAVGLSVSHFVDRVGAREDPGGSLKKAWDYILERTRSEEQQENWGLLESTLVCDTHRVLFEETIVPPNMTRPGHLSNRPRYADVKGYARHWYPVPEDMDSALVSLFDEYNVRYDSCRGAYDKELFLTCAWLTCRFLALHPFGDGNGRLCQILCNYAMTEYHPFPVAFCDTDDYLSLLIKAQATGNVLPLATNMALSTCLAWQSFMNTVNKQ